MPRVFNRKVDGIPEGAVLVARPSIFGNDFVIGRDGSAEEVVGQYEEWLRQPAQADLLKLARHHLRGRDLVCFCAPEPCHADVLLRLANAPAELSGRGLTIAEMLVAYVLDDVLDDPNPPEDGEEAWRDLKSFAEEVGLDIHQIARAEGTDFERERLAEIVGERVG